MCLLSTPVGSKLLPFFSHPWRLLDPAYFGASRKADWRAHCKPSTSGRPEWVVGRCRMPGTPCHFHAPKFSTYHEFFGLHHPWPSSLTSISGWSISTALYFSFPDLYRLESQSMNCYSLMNNPGRRGKQKQENKTVPNKQVSNQPKQC